MISLHEVAGLSPSDYDYSQAQPDLQWASSAESGVSQPLGYKCGKIFRYDIVDAADNVQLNADGSLKSGTFEKLVEKLTSKASDPSFTFEFLLTYRSFCEPLELMDALVQRFTTAMGDDRQVVRLRVVSVLRTWMDKYWNDFSKEGVLGQTLVEFVNYLTNLSGMEKPADQLRKTYERMRTGGVGERERVFNNQNKPKPIIPQISPAGLDILDMHTDELARQITVVGYELWWRIKPWEFLGQAWNKKGKEEKAPNILAMINRFNEMSGWTASEIIRSEQMKRRVKVLQKFIELADKLRQMSNFNACMEIVAGLNNSAVHRLRNTFSALPQKTTALLTELEDLLQQKANYQKLRTAIHSCTPPCIPYLGIYLTDLTFIEDGNKDNNEIGLINFTKRKQIAAVIREIQQYQQTPYYLDPILVMQDYLKKLKFFDEATNYKLSTYIEPKQGAQRPERPPEFMTADELRAAGLAPQTSTNVAFDHYGEQVEFDLEIINGYPFYAKDAPDNIITQEVDGNQVVCAATVAKLVERLTYERLLSDTNYASNFLATFRSFLSPHDFLDLIVMRYNMPRPKNANAEILQKFRELKETPIRLRVFNTLKLWLDRFFSDFRDDPTLLDKLNVFVVNAVQLSNPKFANALQLLIQKQSQVVPAIGLAPPKEPPAYLMQRKQPHEFFIGDFDTEEVAKQLTLITHQHYARIRPSEMTQKRWSWTNADEVAGNVLAFATLQDNIGFNVEIELNKGLDQLVDLGMVIFKWLEVAFYCYMLKNWPMVKTLTWALGRVYVNDLTDIWAGFPPPLKAFYVDMRKICADANELKSIVKGDVQPPLIPALEFYLQDISFVEDGSPDVINNSMVNFSKLNAVGEIMVPLLNFQRYEYSFSPSEFIRNWLLREPLDSELPTSATDDRFSDKSPPDAVMGSGTIGTPSAPSSGTSSPLSHSIGSPPVGSPGFGNMFGSPPAFGTPPFGSPPVGSPKGAGMIPQRAIPPPQPQQQQPSSPSISPGARALPGMGMPPSMPRAIPSAGQNGTAGPNYGITGPAAPHPNPKMPNSVAPMPSIAGYVKAPFPAGPKLPGPSPSVSNGPKLPSGVQQQSSPFPTGHPKVGSPAQMYGGPKFPGPPAPMKTPTTILVSPPVSPRRNTTVQEVNWDDVTEVIAEANDLFGDQAEVETGDDPLPPPPPPEEFENGGSEGESNGQVYHEAEAHQRPPQQAMPPDGSRFPNGQQPSWGVPPPSSPLPQQPMKLHHLPLGAPIPPQPTNEEYSLIHSASAPQLKLSSHFVPVMPSGVKVGFHSSPINSPRQPPPGSSSPVPSTGQGSPGMSRSVSSNNLPSTTPPGIPGAGQAPPIQQQSQPALNFANAKQPVFPAGIKMPSKPAVAESPIPQFPHAGAANSHPMAHQPLTGSGSPFAPRPAPSASPPNSTMSPVPSTTLGRSPFAAPPSHSGAAEPVNGSSRPMTFVAPQASPVGNNFDQRPSFANRPATLSPIPTPSGSGGLVGSNNPFPGAPKKLFPGPPVTGGPPPSSAGPQKMPFGPPPGVSKFPGPPLPSSPGLARVNSADSIPSRPAPTSTPPSITPKLPGGQLSMSAGAIPVGGNNFPGRPAPGAPQSAAPTSYSAPSVTSATPPSARLPPGAVSPFGFPPPSSQLPNGFQPAAGPNPGSPRPAPSSLAPTLAPTNGYSSSPFQGGPPKSAFPGPPSSVGQARPLAPAKFPVASYDAEQQQQMDGSPRPGLPGLMGGPPKFGPPPGVVKFPGPPNTTTTPGRPAPMAPHPNQPPPYM